MRIANYQPRIIYPDVPYMDRDTYEVGLHQFIHEFLDNHDGQVAFYQFGEIRTPGVSDIDLLIVVQDGNWKQARREAKLLTRSSGLLSFLFPHEPLVVSESLVPYLPVFHTLENCRHIEGDWNPIGKAVPELQNRNFRLIRHAVWNSFMRIAALELDDSEIGLRRALALAHNLLTTAYRGNEFLSKPISCPFSTEMIREEVLSAPAVKQESLLKSYIAQIVDLLEEVDERLNREIATNLGYASAPTLLFPISSRRFLLSGSDTVEEIKAGWAERLLGSVQVIPVPMYLMVLVVQLAASVGDQFPDLVPFRCLSDEVNSLTQFALEAYTEQFRKALQLFQAQSVEYCFVRPFSYRRRDGSWRNRIIRRMRRYALRQQLRNQGLFDSSSIAK